MSLTFDLI